MEQWKRFERLAAALHVLEMRGASVVWDDHIASYQIDVSVRFQAGPYRYLHIIECRDHQRPVTREQVAAFAVKVEQTGASKGTVVSSVGFQSGARELAKTKNVDLFTLEEIADDWPDTIMASLPTPFVGIRRIRIRPRGKDSWLQVSEPYSQQFVSHARFEGPSGGKRSLAQVFQHLIPPNWQSLSGRWTIQTDLEGEWTLKSGRVKTVHVSAVQVDLETFAGPIEIQARNPPELRPSRIVYRNVTTSEFLNVPSTDLPFGFDTDITAGLFYTDIAGREYYCQAINNGIVTFILLASRQFSRSVWAEFTAETSVARGHYVEVTDRRALSRLQAAYEEWLDAKNRGLTQSCGFLADPAKGVAYLPEEAFLKNVGTAPWTALTSVELEVELPDGERLRSAAIEGKPTDVRPVAERGFGEIVFVPKRRPDGRVAVAMFDLRDSARELCRLEVRIGGGPIATPTSPVFRVRVIRVFASSPPVESLE